MLRYPLDETLASATFWVIDRFGPPHTSKISRSWLRFFKIFGRVFGHDFTARVISFQIVNRAECQPDAFRLEFFPELKDFLSQHQVEASVYETPQDSVLPLADERSYLVYPEGVDSGPENILFFEIHVSYDQFWKATEILHHYLNEHNSFLGGEDHSVRYRITPIK